jgi:hypothetical protein
MVYSPVFLMNQKWAIFQDLTCQSCEEIKQNDIFQMWKTGNRYGEVHL